MKGNKFIFLISFVFVLGLVNLGFAPKDKEKTQRINKTNSNDNSNFIAINQCFMWIGNNGMGSHNPISDDSGFYWPGGRQAVDNNEAIPAIFADGLIWGAKVGREIRVNGATYRYGLQAGKILDDGTADDPSLSKYRIFKIRKDWESLSPGAEKDQYEKDYNEWPVEDGAPWVDVDGDGIFTRGVDEPKFLGDEVLWCVSNDLDASRSTFTYGTLPMGLEMQTTVFAFNRTGDLGDMVFKKYLLINKGDLTLRDVVLGYWSDTDLGFANDDFTGCDTVLSLGYTYNGDNDDEDAYGPNPPANGYDFFQGPIVPSENPNDSAKFLDGWRKGFRNLPMTAFTFYINSSTIYSDPDLGLAAGSVQFYNYLTGKVWDGSPFIDPNTGEAVNFVLAGDPVAGTGWYEGDGWPGGPAPGDRRHLMASGPFTMAPGDTQEVVVGILIARGSNNINSITELKRKDLAAQIAYDLDFQLTPPPPAPEVSAFTDEGEVTLYWSTNAESYDEPDPLIFNKGFDDTTYTFQGYRIWQYSNISGSDPTLLAIYDIQDDIDIITETQIFGEDTVEIPVFSLENLGLAHFYRTRVDKIGNNPLINARPYFFAITAFGYSPNSNPKYLENSPQIISVIPGRQGIDITYPFNSGESLVAEQSEGTGDGLIKFHVIDPLSLTGDQYEISVQSEGLVEGDTTYSIINKTKTDTLDAELSDFGADSLLSKKVYDGFVVTVENVGLDSLKAVPTEFRVKSVEEYQGPNGVILDPPIDVFNSPNSTGQWEIVVNHPSKRLNWQDVGEGLGYNNYEIRFTGSSYYYITGRGSVLSPPQYKSDTLATDGSGTPLTLPFEIYDVGRSYDDPSDDVKLRIKVLDFLRSDPTSSRFVADYKWTQLPSGDWEEIYAYFSTVPEDSLYSGISDPTDHKFGGLSFRGEIPEPGTVIRITSYKGLSDGDKFVITLPKANVNDVSNGQQNLDQITVFPNPYFGAHSLEANKYNRWVRFTGLPEKCTVRIFSLAGVFVRKLDKDNSSQYLEWDLLNSNGIPVASGIYIAYLELPGIGTKVMKLAIIQETQFLDRL